jgi:hypothetical protein
MSKPDDIHPPVKVRQPDSRFPVMTYFTDKGKAVGSIELDRVTGSVNLFPSEQATLHIRSFNENVSVFHRGQYLSLKKVEALLDVVHRVCREPDPMVAMVAPDLIRSAYEKMLEEEV